MINLKISIPYFIFIVKLKCFKSSLDLYSSLKFLLYHFYCKLISPFFLANNYLNRFQSHCLKYRSDGLAYFYTQNSELLAQRILNKIKSLELSEDVWDEFYRLKLDPFSTFPELLELFDSDLGNFIEYSLGSNYFIHYGLIYKSIRQSNEPTGSQLWHTDAGPGTCMNLMFCLSETTALNGAMKCLPWKDSMKIQFNLFKYFKNLGSVTKNRNEFRALKSGTYEKIINLEYSDKVIQPIGRSGLIYAFRNNCLHSGGFTSENHSRYVCIFHIYPSHKKARLIDYCHNGVAKKSPYPKI